MPVSAFLRSPPAFAAAGLCAALVLSGCAHIGPAPTGANDDEAAHREQRDEGRERADRGAEQAAPQAVGDAPLPPQGAPAPQPIITRGPLTIRRAEASIGFDHALSPRWVASGLLGISRGRLHRFQTDLPPDAAPGTPLETSDTVIHTRSTSLTGMLSYLPGGDVFYDAALSFMTTRFDVHRVVNDLAFFDGRNAGRSWSLSLNAARVWRQGVRTLLPQLGLDYTQARVDPLSTEFGFFDDPTREAGFSVSRQRSRTLAAQAGLQVQWPHSAGFGVWSPYARATLRQRVWMSADTIVATAPGATPVLTEAQSITPRSAATLAGGVQLQWPHGIGGFAELGVTRANGNLRETRLATGVKFEF